METLLRAALLDWLRADPTLSAGLNAMTEEAPGRTNPPWLGLVASAGAVEAAVLALTVARGAIPPTINHGETDADCAVDVVANEAREQKIRCAVSTSLGFGGNDSAIVMRAV